MTTEVTTEGALSRIETLLTDAPAHIREQWTGLKAYLDDGSADAGETDAAAAHADELLKQVSVRANMFQGSNRSFEITVDFPFEIKEWFDGHSHFDFEGESCGRSEDERMLAFYRQQDAERKRLHALVRSSVTPIVLDCLRRMLARDMRQDQDRVLHAIRHAAWRTGGMSGPRPQPAGEPPLRSFSMVDGVMRERQP